MLIEINIELLPIYKNNLIWIKNGGFMVLNITMQ
jgi:hypothetical protein